LSLIKDKDKEADKPAASDQGKAIGIDLGLIDQLSMMAFICG
jgi:hypothetical protein